MTTATSPAARVYAEALLALGREKDNLARIGEDLKAILELYDESREFRLYFDSPLIDADAKFKVLKDSLGGKIDREVLGLLRVMIRKGREPILRGVAEQFERLKDVVEGRVHVFVRAARPFTEEQNESIRTNVETATGMQAVIHETVEPELIGGAVVRVGDKIIDGSVRARLRSLRKDLLKGERIF